MKVNLFSQMGDNWFNSWVSYYAARAELWIAICVGADTWPSRVYVWDTGTLKWGIRTMPQIPGADTGPIPFPETNNPSWDAQTEDWDNADRIWNKAVLASAASGLILADPDLAGSGAAPRFVSIDNLVNGPDANLYDIASVTRADLDLDDPDHWKTITAIWARVSGKRGDQLIIRLTGRDGSSSGVSTSQFRSWSIGNSVKSDFRSVTGRYITITFEAQNASVEPFVINGFAIEYETAGEF
jgi:hypothetical protein